MSPDAGEPVIAWPAARHCVSDRSWPTRSGSRLRAALIRTGGLQVRTNCIAALVAAALAAAPGTRASAQDMGEAVAGLAALAILGAIMSQTVDDAPDRTLGRLVTRGYAPPRLPAPAVRPLPGRCELADWRNQGVHGEKCLRRAGVHTDWLPRGCRFASGRGHRYAFDARCLQHGAFALDRPPSCTRAQLPGRPLRPVGARGQMPTWGR